MKKNYPIIGIAGSNGSGKDTVAAMLGERHGFFVASATKMLGDELTRRDMTHERVNKAALSAEWRKKYGMGAIVDRAVEEFEALDSPMKGIAVGSLRHPGEAEEVQRLGGIVIWTDADPKVRYDRITEVLREGREHEDSLSFERWQADEEREMQHHSGDNTTLNVAGVKAVSDITIRNDKNDIKGFMDQAETQLSEYLATFE